MATIAKLDVALSMGTAKFTSGVKSGISGLNSLMGSVFSVKGAIVGLGAALGAGAAVAGLKSMVSQSMETIDVLAKVSDRLGITTESLIGLRHAANLSGVGAEQFDKTLEKMLRNIGQAVTKGGPAADALKAIGLDAVAVSQMAPDQAFLKIADGIKAIENPALRAKVATDIFGKSGQQLLNTLMAGSEGIAAMTAETELFGTAISRVDAAEVEAANDSMTRAGEVITGLGTQLAVQLAPLIDFAAKKFTDFATSGSGAGGLVSAALGGVVSAIAFVADAAQVIGQAFTITFAAAQTAVNFAIKVIVDGLNYLVTAAQEAAKMLGADLGSGGLSFLTEFSKGLDRTIADSVKTMQSTEITATWGDQIKKGWADIKTESKTAGEAVAKEAAKTQATIAEIDTKPFEKPDKKKKEKKDTIAEPQGVAAVTKGTSAAISAIETARRTQQKGKDDAAAKTAKNSELSVSLQREQVRLLREQGKVKTVSIGS